MRGRLIFRLIAELYRLDGENMVVGAPPGYDPDFDEPARIAPGAPVRRELAPVRVACQVEPGDDQALTLGAAGDLPRSRLGLVLHMRDLERAALIDGATGRPLVRPGDRLGALYDRSGALVETFTAGLFLVEATPLSYGLGLLRPRPNLLLCSFLDRPQGIRRP
jgi:hypothetical protein